MSSVGFNRLSLLAILYQKIMKTLQLTFAKAYLSTKKDDELLSSFERKVLITILESPKWDLLGFAEKPFHIYLLQHRNEGRLSHQ